MILNREQIDAHFTLRRAMDDDFRNGTYRTDWTSIHALINGTDALIATARAYHDLRDAVLALCDEADRNHEAYLAGIIMDRFIVPSNVTTGNLRALVARVERGEAF